MAELDAEDHVTRRFQAIIAYGRQIADSLLNRVKQEVDKSAHMAAPAPIGFDISLSDKQPAVCCPGEAPTDCFLCTGMQALVFGGHIAARAA